MPGRKVGKPEAYSRTVKQPIVEVSRRGKKRASPMKAGLRCPACGDVIFSLSVHDYRTCACGRTFVDGGDEYMRCGTADGLFAGLQTVEVPRAVAKKMMATQPGKRSPTKGPKGFQFVWWPERWWRLWPESLGPWPYDLTGGKIIEGTARPYHGCVYSARWTFGPLEVRKWAS